MWIWMKSGEDEFVYQMDHSGFVSACLESRMLQIHNVPRMIKLIVLCRLSTEKFNWKLFVSSAKEITWNEHIQYSFNFPQFNDVQFSINRKQLRISRSTTYRRTANHRQHNLHVRRRHDYTQLQVIWRMNFAKWFHPTLKCSVRE